MEHVFFLHFFQDRIICAVIYRIQRQRFQGLLITRFTLWKNWSNTSYISDSWNSNLVPASSGKFLMQELVVIIIIIRVFYRWLPRELQPTTIQTSKSLVYRSFNDKYILGEGIFPSSLILISHDTKLRLILFTTSTSMKMLCVCVINIGGNSQRVETNNNFPMSTL